MANKQFGWGKRCDRCGKGFQNIKNLSHSHIRTNKKSMPNLHKTTLMVGGVIRQFRFCTKCLRIMKETFAQVRAEAAKIVTEAQVGIRSVIETKKVIQTPEEAVVTPAEVVEEAVVEEPVKAKKALKIKTKKESSRKKSISDILAEVE